MATRILLVAVFSSCGAETVTHFPHSSVRQEIRPTDTSVSQMFRFDAAERVERFGVDGGAFLVHYTRAGRNAVPSADSNSDGVPDFVEDVARVYEDVGARYVQWGFRAPPRDGTVMDNGGDDRFDVYLIDFARTADGAFRQDACLTNREICTGYMVQENDFVGYGYPSLTEATRVLGSHEFFHATQSAYDSTQDVIISEGSAVWATEQYHPQSSDFENAIRAFLANPARSIDSVPPGPVPSSAYGSAIFFRFLTERFDASVVRKLWEHLENGGGFDSEPANKADPTWVIQLDALLKAEYQSSFQKAFEEFATWNLYLGSAADPSQSYDDAARYPQLGTTSTSVPYKLFPMRVFYASAQYFRVPLDGRTALAVELLDDPDVPGDETAGLAVLAAVRRGGRNLAVRRGGGSIDTTGADEVVVGVVNGARSGVGAILSKRPGLCIGSASEVDACRASITGQTVDAGVPGQDAGTGGVVVQSAPSDLPGARTGCSHGLVVMTPLALLMVLGRRRQSSRSSSSR